MYIQVVELQFPPTKRWFAVKISAMNISVTVCRWICSNIHLIIVTKVYHYHSCGRVAVTYFIAIRNQSSKHFSVYDNLWVSVSKHRRGNLRSLSKWAHRLRPLVLRTSQKSYRRRIQCLFLHRRTQKCGVDWDCVLSYSCKHKMQPYRRHLEHNNYCLAVVCMFCLWVWWIMNENDKRFKFGQL